MASITLATYGFTVIHSDSTVWLHLAIDDAFASKHSNEWVLTRERIRNTIRIWKIPTGGIRMEQRYIRRYLDVDALQQRLAQLDKEIGPRVQERDELKAFLELYIRDDQSRGSDGDEAEEMDGPEGATEGERAQPEAATVNDGASTSGVRELGGRALLSEAMAVLREHGGKLSTNDIRQRLAERGIVPKGTNRTQAVYSVLFRHELTTHEVLKVAPGEWEAVMPALPGDQGGDAQPT